MIRSIYYLWILIFSMTLPVAWAQDFDSARKAWAENRFADAVSIARPLAEAGSSSAREMLGFAYISGRGVAQDKSEAFKWTQLAADAGRVSAQFYLAMMYSRGDGVEINLEKSILYLQRAASGGNMFAQAELGERYFYGVGIQKDVEQAKFWLGKALDSNLTTPGVIQRKARSNSLLAMIAREEAAKPTANSRVQTASPVLTQSTSSVPPAGNYAGKGLRSGLNSNDPRLICDSAVSAAPYAQVLTGKMALVDFWDVSFPMLSNQSVPTQNEQEAIAAWADDVRKCIQNSYDYRRKNYSKELLAILDREDDLVMAAAIDLYNKKINFGGYNFKIQQIYKESRSALESFRQVNAAQEDQSKARIAAMRDAQQRQEQQQLFQQRQEEQRRAAEQSKAAAIRQQWNARCELDKRNAYERYSKSKENNCSGGTNKALGVLCVFATVGAADDYANAAFNSCMSGAPAQ